ncbi:MAG: TonB-dependent receptor [Thermotogota bacterium]
MKKIKLLSYNIVFLITLLILLKSPAAQEFEPLTVKNEYKNLNTYDFFDKIEANYDIRFFYVGLDSIPDIKIHFTNDSNSIYSILKNNLSPYNIKVFREQNNFFLLKDKILKTNLADNFFISSKNNISDKKPTSTDTANNNYIKTYNDYINKSIVIGNNHKNNHKKTYKLSGKVMQLDDNSPVSQATIHIKEIDKYTATNISGEYSMKLERGDYTLIINNLGNYEKKYKIKVLSDGKLNIKLKRKTYTIDEAVVTAKEETNVESTQMGLEKISPKKMSKMPVLMGEKDIGKLALMLPGVQTMSEISSGYNIRGSNSDQNMFYLDNMPIYNASHLFGLYTSFSSDAISDFSLYKNNIPIEYGGQLSSIFDIEAHKGDLEEFSAKGEIGFISSQFIMEGPIKEKKSSYLISGRTTYSDWLLNKVNNSDIQNSSASFRDGLVKFYFNPDSINNISLLTYGSIDKSDLAFGINNQYKNAGANLNWKHYFNEDKWIETDISYSDYSFNEEKTELQYQAKKYSFNLKHSEFKLNYINQSFLNHNINYGINSIFYKLENGEVQPLNDLSYFKPIKIKNEQAWKNSLFISDEWEATTNLTIKAGVRATLFSYLGPNTIYSYSQGYPRESSYIKDSVSYGKNSFIKNYPRIDYRFSGKYSLADDLSIKASYNKQHQYIFMLSDNILPSPTNKWKLTDPHIKPMEGNQLSLGVYKNFGKKIETSIETYYKKSNNIVEFKDGAEFITSPTTETEIIQGDLDAYGIEFMLRKKVGKLTGWLNYTYSHTSVKAVNHARNEKINFGKPYPANYDKPHALNLTTSYNFTKKFNVSANVVYATGRPVTYPTSIYYQNDVQIVNYSERNQYRLKNYFRIDFSLNIEGNLKKDKLFHGSWSFSVYNLTGRKNPYSLSFKNEDGKIKGYRTSVLGAMIPSIKYKLKLGNYAK